MISNRIRCREVEKFRVFISPKIPTTPGPKISSASQLLGPFLKIPMATTQNSNIAMAIKKASSNPKSGTSKSKPSQDLVVLKMVRIKIGRWQKVGRNLVFTWGSKSIPNHHNISARSKPNPPQSPKSMRIMTKIWGANSKHLWPTSYKMTF